MYWCGYLYFITRGEKIYVNQRIRPHKIKEYGVDDNRNRFYPYFKEPLFSKVMLLLRTMDQISEERNVPLSQIALNWTLQRPFISSCIIGAQSRDKIEENCKVFEWKLSDDEMQLLEQALKKTII